LKYSTVFLRRCQNEQYRMKLQKSNERLLALIKSSLDIVVAVGLLQLAPKKVTPRVTGAFGFASSLIACYQVQNTTYPLPCYLFIVSPWIIQSLKFHSSDSFSRSPGQLLPSPAKSK
jgi:hypothetical protein